MTRTMRVVAAVIALALAVPAAASAEFAGLYLGFALTSNGDVEFDPDSGSRFVPRTFNDVELDKSVVWGGRGGYWFSKDEIFGELGEFFGVALDLSHFRPRIRRQTVDTNLGRRFLAPIDVSNVLLTPEALIRYKLLKSDEFPAGRLHVYGAFGPTLFLSSAQDAGSFGRRNALESDVDLGLVAGPGAAWWLNDLFAIFVEYRFVHMTPSFDFSAGTVDVPINSHQFNIGVSYRF